MGKKERIFPISTIGGRIQKRRHELKMSRSDLYDCVYSGGKAGSDNSKDRTVLNWESNKTELNYDTLPAMCHALNCSADYLLGLDDCTNKSIQFIHDYTGLSEDAINFLNEINNSNTIARLCAFKFSILYEKGEKPYIYLLNYLLRKDRDTISLLDYLYQYIFRSNFKYYIDDEDYLHSSVKLTDKEGRSWTSYNVSELYNMLLLNINNCLANIRKNFIEKNNTSNTPDTH